MASLLTTSLHLFSEVRTAIDIGTGKVKMQVARVEKDRIEPLFCCAESLQLSKYLQGNMLTREGEEKLISVLTSFQLKGKSLGAIKCEAIATEFFRKINNGPELTQKLASLLDMNIRIITPEEEGIFSFLTVMQESHRDPQKLVVLDIGSGSFQITCKKGDQYLVYSAPFGRIPTYERIKKEGSLEGLVKALKQINQDILDVLRICDGTVIGVGAHSKCIIHSKSKYREEDVKKALVDNPDFNLDHTDLLLIQTIMEQLSIKQVDYLISHAGNTSGVLKLFQEARQ